MAAASSRTDYEERLNRVTSYIYENLDDGLDLETLAEVACLSPYHWHRIYRATRGETIAATVKRLRLHRAAGYLAQTAMGIAEIADRCGYPNVPSFTRVFESVYGMPPGRYRREGSHTRFQVGAPDRSPHSYEIAIVTLPPQSALTIEHRGSYMEIGKSFDALYGWLIARNLVQPDMRSVAIFYDDPSSVPEKDLRSRAGVVPSAPLDVEFPLELTGIAGREYAVLMHTGPYANMKAAYQWLYGEWLQESGREPANEPVFEEYLNSPRETPPSELMTKICLPLA
jgi:AraC family transcriptional regulator